MLTGAVIVLMGVVALLAIPITLTFHIGWRQAFANDITLQWAFGLVRARIRTDKPTGVHSVNELAELKTARPRRSFRKQWHVFAAVRHKGFRQRVIRFVGDLWRAVHKRDVRLRVRVGLGDPADTGQLWAILGPISGLLANVPDASITVEPEFLDATIELDSSGSIRLIPLQLVYLMSALLLSPHVWQGISQMRKPGR
jgi:hypothetical protein